MLIKALFEKTALNFYKNFLQKAYFPYKPEQMSLMMEFNLFKLV